MGGCPLVRVRVCVRVRVRVRVCDALSTATLANSHFYSAPQTPQVTSVTADIQAMLDTRYAGQAAATAAAAPYIIYACIDLKIK